jgi:hypothetical protein
MMGGHRARDVPACVEMRDIEGARVPPQIAFKAQRQEKLPVIGEPVRNVWEHAQHDPVGRA